MKYYVVDVFTDQLFGGNPAGVCLLDGWPSDSLLQSIAAENNLSETAFLVKQAGYYDLRWFTPEIEIDLCGHATMGSAHILFEFFERNAHTLRFKTQSGLLTVDRGDGGMLWMDFPARPGVSVANYMSVSKALGIENYVTYKSADILVVVENEDIVKNIAPDFVSRFFAPNAGVCEDPVTGRAHCVLIPYWSNKLWCGEINFL